jgi:hypothetical protein
MNLHHHSSWANALSLGLVVIAITGCATTETTRSVTTIRVPAPVDAPAIAAPVPAAVIGTGLSLGEVIGQIKTGKPQTEIIAAVRQQGLQSSVNAADIDLLLANGASRELIDAMLQAPRMVSGPVIAPAPSSATTTTTVIQSVPVPVVTGSVGYRWGWGNPGWGARSAWSNPWGWGAPPRVVAPVIVSPAPVFRPPVVVGPPPVIVSPGAGVHVPGPGFGNPAGSFGRFQVPHGPQGGISPGFGARGGGPATRVHKN